MGQFTEGLITIALGILGLAVISILVSKNANTTGVIQAGASGFGNLIGVAGAPVTGTQVSIDLSYPGMSSSSGGINF